MAMNDAFRPSPRNASEEDSAGLPALAGSGFAVGAGPSTRPHGRLRQMTRFDCSPPLSWTVSADCLMYVRQSVPIRSANVNPIRPGAS